ncbi:MAG: SMC family ATPase [SAR86 cluster bacterium]|nr:SMC family ATPase [SAR86 cluster bacterium]
MNIRSLSIRNYRSIKELNIDFPESGLIGIVGHNGAGKSSLLESIGWALYGTQAIRGKADGLTTIGAKGKCKVIMEFDHGDNGPYTIERTLKDAKLESSGKEIAVMTSGVNSQIEKILNMDYRAFYTSIFTKQGGLSSFTDMTASQRQETVERLLEVSKVKDARINIGAEARALENQLQGKRVAIQSEDEIIDKIAEQQKIKSQLMQTEKELDEILAETKKQKLKADEKLKKIEIKQKSFRDAKENFLKSENKLRIYETELKNAKSSISGIQEKLERAKKRSIDLQKIMADDVTKDLEKKMKESDKIVKEIKRLSDTINQMKIQYGKEDARIEDKQTHIDQIGKLGSNSKCPVCLRSLGEHGPKVIDELNKEIETIKLKNNPDEIKENEKKVEEWNLKKRQLEDEIRKLNDRNLKSREAEGEFKTLGLENLELEKTKINETLKEKTKEIKAQEKIVNKAKTELNKIGFDENEYNTIRNNWDKAGDELFSSIENLERHKSSITKVSENLRNQEERIQEITKLKSEIKDEERNLKLLRTLEERLKGFRTYLTGRIAPVLQNRTGERLSQITQARYNSVHVDRNDYSIQVMDGTQLYPLERFSGGEVDAFNLAFRLSISDVITERLGSELGMVVLDEVLGSQDYQRQTSILLGLENLAKNIGQVMMVTHIEGIKDQLQHVWSVSLDFEKGTQVKIL